MKKNQRETFLFAKTSFHLPTVGNIAKKKGQCRNTMMETSVSRARKRKRAVNTKPSFEARWRHHHGSLPLSYFPKTGFNFALIDFTEECSVFTFTLQYKATWGDCCCDSDRNRTELVVSWIQTFKSVALSSWPQFLMSCVLDAWLIYLSLGFCLFFIVILTLIFVC